MKRAIYQHLLAWKESPSAKRLPLSTTENEKKFKVFFLDTGLVSRSNKLSINNLTNPEVLLLNKGNLMEQFAAQEFIAYQNYFDRAQLFFWARDKRGSQAEIDFLTNVNDLILPIEVKAGPQSRSKSLKLFLEERNLPLGIHISALKPERKDKILRIPLYLIGELERLVKSLDL